MRTVKLTGSRIPMVQIIAVAGLMLGLASGCVSDNQWKASMSSYDRYVAKVEQTYQPVLLSGSNMTISVTGVDTLCVSAPLNKVEKPAVPYDAAKDGIKAVEKIAGYTAAAWVVGKAIDGSDSTSVSSQNTTTTTTTGN